MNQPEMIAAFVEAANAFDVEAAVSLFSAEATIEDESVGSLFAGPEGVRLYLERYFVGYHTRSSLLGLENRGAGIRARLDFVGDFGHETGTLDFTFDSAGLFHIVEASLD